MFVFVVNGKGLGWTKLNVEKIHWKITSAPGEASLTAKYFFFGQANFKTMTIGTKHFIEMHKQFKSVRDGNENTITLTDDARNTVKFTRLKKDIKSQ